MAPELLIDPEIGGTAIDTGIIAHHRPGEYVRHIGALKYHKGIEPVERATDVKQLAYSLDNHLNTL